MRQIFSWADRVRGDVFFTNDPTSELSKLIIDAEETIHPTTPDHPWVPSHTGAFLGDGRVIEAWMDWHENSAAAINPESKYDGFFGKGQMQIWRPSFSVQTIDTALQSLQDAFAGDKYGLLNLPGFEYEALVAWLTGEQVDNPIMHSEVCSQTMYAYIAIAHALGGGEDWVTVAKVRNTSPDLLLRDFEAYRSY